MRLDVSRAAQEDLLEIWAFVAEGSPEAADRLIRQITRTFDTLLAQPEMDRLRDEFQVPLRSHPLKRYVIFYRLLEDRIEIIRVLHGSRDVDLLDWI